jgi:hypothetical protein
MSQLLLLETIPAMASRQLAMAFMSLSAGFRLGLVIDLCWNWTVSDNLSLLVDLM